jgi:hypothetical protein
MTIGNVNPAIPDAYIQVQTPSPNGFTGLSTDKICWVGTASWGPVNAPTPFGLPSQYAAIFGPLKNRKYDMGTVAATAQQLGANNNIGVRVTDGTDVAATAIVQTNCLTVTSKYTGSAANGDTLTISSGSQANTYKLTIARAGYAPEVFDNIGGTANAFWVNAAAAINTGSGVQGPSQYMVASAGAGTTAPTLATTTLSGGLDGATTITSTVLLGADTGTRSGMYALRGTGPAIMVLADCDTSTSWATQVTFALAEGMYAIATGPSGEFSNLSTVASNKATAGIDSYAMKLLVGDWCLWNDTVNGVTRYVSPQGFAAGRLAVQGPEQSGLNKPITNIIGTQKSMANQTYSAADLTIIGNAGLDVITNPCPGGAYFGLRFGQNTSSNSSIDGDNYSRLTPYYAYSLNAVAGKFVGQLQTADERRQAKAAIDSFFQGEWFAGRISNPQGTQPWRTILDDSNNPASRVSAGYQQADVKVQYGPVITQFVVNLEAGQTVQITSKPA